MPEPAPLSCERIRAIGRVLAKFALADLNLHLHLSGAHHTRIRCSLDRLLQVGLPLIALDPPPLQFRQGAVVIAVVPELKSDAAAPQPMPSARRPRHGKIGKPS